MNRAESQSLQIFLLGTIDPNSSLRKLRGQSDILRIIWTVVCEEWWSLHIGWYEPKHYRYRGMNLDVTGYRLPPNLIRSTEDIPDLSSVKVNSLNREWKVPEEPDHVFSGCPLAVIGKNISFPPISHLPAGSYQGQVDDILNINMMPFDLANPQNTLPNWCHGYLPMIQKCIDQIVDLSVSVYDFDFESLTGYLTIDERPIIAGKSHRRGGVHVESSLWPVELTPLPSAIARSNNELIPASICWGGGPIRASRITGGLFLCSNTSQSTAVWNCQVLDRQGHLLGKHGSVEHCRNLLGSASKVLQSGELVWLTDHTPHESLPLPPPYTTNNNSDNRRQFFRLVVGKVSAWFVDHNTPNPLQYPLDSTVQCILGNKFHTTTNISTIANYWQGSRSIQEMIQAQEVMKLRKVLCVFELGHLLEPVLEQGIHSIDQLIEDYEAMILYLWQHRRDSPYDEGAGMECDEDMIRFMIQELINNPIPTTPVLSHTT